MLAGVIVVLHCGFSAFSLVAVFFLTPAVFVYVGTVESAMMARTEVLILKKHDPLASFCAVII